MKKTFRLAVVAASLAVAACGTLRSIDLGAGDYWVKSARPLTRAESALHYFDYARNLSTSEYGREVDAMRHSFSNDKSDLTRLRYALLLSVPGTARDPTRAQQLLDALRNDVEGRDPALRALAILLASELADIRRLEDSLQTATQRQKDEQARAKEEQARAKEEQARANDLEQKLEALKTIEKSIDQRDRKTAVPAPPHPVSKTVPK